MAQLELYLPVKPYSLNQGWGANHDYYFSHFNMQGHNGLDLMASHGQPVYAPMDGWAYYYVDADKGDGIFIVSDKMYDYNSGQALFKCVTWHMCQYNDPQYPIKMGNIGYTYVHIGDLLGYADNTGAPLESTGDHCHFGLYPEKPENGTDYSEGFTDIEIGNGYNGAIDPTPYLNNFFAQDYAQVQSIQSQAVSAVSQTVEAIQNDAQDTPTQKLNWLQSLLNLLKFW